jgi:hypothetical protein
MKKISVEDAYPERQRVMGDGAEWKHAWHIAAGFPGR